MYNQYKRGVKLSEIFSVLLYSLFGLSFLISNIYSQDSSSKIISNKDNPITVITPEHVAFNVNDPISEAEWFVKNLGFKIMLKGDAPNNTRFIADEKVNMMLELYNNKKCSTMDLNGIHYMTLHFALMTDSIEKTKEKLISAGASLAEDISKTASGDKVLMLRDPWGLPIQFVERVKPMLKYSAFRPEHLAANVLDPIAKAKWYSENLNMKIIKQGGAPNYGTFIADANDHMMMELYHNVDYPLMDFENTNHIAFHFAFTVEDVAYIKTKLLSAGAKVVEDITKNSSGAIILVMRDPWGEPIQFIKRPVLMLK